MEKRLKVLIYDTHSFEKENFCSQNESYHHELNFFEGKLNEKTVDLAKGFPCICPFVNDKINREIIQKLSQNGTKLIALRSAGFNHVDLNAAQEFSMKVVRVPEYSPYSVAEHAVGLLLALNRKIYKAYNRVRDGNFSLEGLVGFDLHGKSIGVIGTGKIGKVFIDIMKGFGCYILAYDLIPDAKFMEDPSVKYVTLDEVFKSSDVISLHLPLSRNNLHFIDQSAIDKMKTGVILINTSRGKLIDTQALIKGLKSGRLGGAGLDVYEEEENYFFSDHSNDILSDDQLARLMTFPNVLLTSHQGFLTREALSNIAQITLQNIKDFEENFELVNEVKI